MGYYLLHVVDVNLNGNPHLSWFGASDFSAWNDSTSGTYLGIDDLDTVNGSGVTVQFEGLSLAEGSSADAAVYVSYEQFSGTSSGAPSFTSIDPVAGYYSPATPYATDGGGEVGSEVYINGGVGGPVFNPTIASELFPRDFVIPTRWELGMGFMGAGACDFRITAVQLFVQTYEPPAVSPENWGVGSSRIRRGNWTR